MSYKTYHEQLSEHIDHLRSNGLDVEELKIDSDKWDRCRAIGKSHGRGDFCYISNTEKLSNGLYGIKTSYRGQSGIGSFKTYGLWPDGNESNPTYTPKNCLTNADTSQHEQAACRAYGFWNHSNTYGSSDYLDRKGVGYYGIKFRSDEKYGNVAVVPMRDECNHLWNYQILNSDGTKHMGKDARTSGVFHKLKELVDGNPIGIAEGYVTAATCMELSGIPMICAFSSENLVAVTKILVHLFPASHIFMFADNDRHLVERGLPNKGVVKASEARDVNSNRVSLVIPDFGNLEPSKDASDWNDLVRLLGNDFAATQIMKHDFCQKHMASYRKED